MNRREMLMGLVALSVAFGTGCVGKEEEEQGSPQNCSDDRGRWE